MAYYSQEEKIKDIGYIIGAIIGFALAFLLCWIFNIDAVKEYGWFAGWWHGAWMPINWIRSWFYDGIYVMAPNHTTGYVIFWWVFGILGILTYLSMVLGCIGRLRRLMN